MPVKSEAKLVPYIEAIYTLSVLLHNFQGGHGL